jgi:SAM-dependent methyltransferase
MSATVVPDPVAELKSRQAKAWGIGNFDVITFLATIHSAPTLVRYAGILPGQKVLDVGTGTGVVALAAARAGGEVTGVDFAPQMIDRARLNAEKAGVAGVSFDSGDAECLPFPDESFDVVLSQFGHMFAPRPEVATAEMLRTLRQSGRLAFATWPPGSVPGRLLECANRYVPIPTGIPGPVLWGDRAIVRARLGDSVGDLEFAESEFYVRALSPQHYVDFFKANFGPMQRTFEALGPDESKLRSYEDELLAIYSEGMDIGGANIRHQYLLTLARKV